MVEVTRVFMAIRVGSTSRVALGLIFLMLSPIFLALSSASTPNDISIDGDLSDWPNSTNMGVDSNDV